MKQEVIHRMMSQSFVDRTHSPRYVNLKNDMMQINVETTNDVNNKDSNNDNNNDGNIVQEQHVSNSEPNADDRNINGDNIRNDN